MAFKSNGCNTIGFHIVSRTRRMNAKTVLGLLVTFLAVWELPTLQALAQVVPHAQLVEEAKKEGQLDWYTTMSVVDHTRYLELFNRKYPFIKVNVRRVGGERLITIFTTEYRAGKTMFDVVISSGVAPSLIKSGIFAWRPNHLGQDSHIDFAAARNDFFAHAGLYRSRINRMTLGFFPNLGNFVRGSG